jgi:imidazole glycerol-phosphate synthase subunit HisH
MGTNNSVLIIDYGMGNVGSIFNMLKHIGIKAKITSDPSEIELAAKLILPGIGSFDYGMTKLAEGGFIPALIKRVIVDRCPILGICLGMQLFTVKSEEGRLDGLGWIQAETKRFCFPDKNGTLKIPHMGWNTVKPKNRETLFTGFEDPPRFYFVHSYHVCCESSEIILGASFYGHEFVAAVQKDNIMGTQFHPEKSHKYGMKLLKNFVDIT